MTSQPKEYKEYIQSNIVDYLAYQRRALENEPEMTKRLKAMLRNRFNESSEMHVLDIGCGNGNTMFHLRHAFPRWHYTGVDVVANLIDDGRKLFSNIDNIELHVGDAHDVKFKKQFGLVLLWRVLQGLGDWERAMRAAFKQTEAGGYLIISTLLNDADVDISVLMRDHTAEGAVKDVPLHILSLSRFEAFCRREGAKTFESEPFEMPIDLPRPERGLNTYTRRLQDGKRIQIAGGLLVDHWKIVTLTV